MVAQPQYHLGHYWDPEIKRFGDVLEEYVARQARSSWLALPRVEFLNLRLHLPLQVPSHAGLFFLHRPHQGRFANHQKATVRFGLCVSSVRDVGR